MNGFSGGHEATQGAAQEAQGRLAGRTSHLRGLRQTAGAGEDRRGGAGVSSGQRRMETSVDVVCTPDP